VLEEAVSQTKYFC